MARPDDLEARVTALEQQVRDLTAQVRHNAQDAAAARVLAGGADRDVGEIRGELRDFRAGTTAGFNALRVDFTDLRSDFTDMRSEMRSGMERIVGLLNTLIADDGRPVDD